MTDLKKLKVSLTKHGAHKAAELIKAFPKDEILENTWNKYKGIKIDLAQTKRNLSANKDGILPEIWDKVKKLGEESIDDLVFLAIVFSHHELIKTMIESSTENGKGTIVRDKVLAGKAFTNFACILDELGLATKHTHTSVSYNLNRMFFDENFPSLAVELFNYKLIEAGWDRKTDIIEECSGLNFHKALSVTPEFFEDWLKGHVQVSYDKSEDIFEEEPDIQDFKFKSGHSMKKEESIIKTKSKAKRKATLLHNEIQNKLFNYLVKIYGEECVGTEVDSGIGTTVDIVVKKNTEYHFYEIKTEKLVRKCIRQAIPQLLEYAYWPNRDTSNKLIIVSQNKITDQANAYLNHLRKKFGIPIYYQRFDLKTDILEEQY